jgi:hypothetical protein
MLKNFLAQTIYSLYMDYKSQHNLPSSFPLPKPPPSSRLLEQAQPCPPYSRQQHVIVLVVQPEANSCISSKQVKTGGARYDSGVFSGRLNIFARVLSLLGRVIKI